MRGTRRDTEFVEFVTAQRAALLRMARLLAAGDEQKEDRPGAYECADTAQPEEHGPAGADTGDAPGAASPSHRPSKVASPAIAAPLRSPDISAHSDHRQLRVARSAGPSGGVVPVLGGTSPQAPTTATASRRTRSARLTRGRRRASSRPCPSGVWTGQPDTARRVTPTIRLRPATGDYLSDRRRIGYLNSMRSRRQTPITSGMISQIVPEVAICAHCSAFGA